MYREEPSRRVLLPIALFIILLGVVLAVAATVGLIHKRRQRHSGRVRRTEEYAERRQRWNAYLRLNPERGMQRLTDQRTDED
jgi:Flp pilus assembly protein TadB